MTNRAPGFRTRAASRSPPSRSARLRTPNPTSAPSNRAAGNGSASASAATGTVRGSLVPPSRQHRDGEIGADHPAAEAVAARQLRGEVQGASAEIEIGSVGFRFPVEPRDGGAAPGPIHVEAQQMVQEVV